MSRDYSPHQQALAGQELPLAWLDKDALDENVQCVLAQVEDKPIRIVTKSIRSVEVLRYLLSAHARFQGLMCFHAAEAAWLAEQGFDDLLVAYPTMQAKAIEKVVQQTAKGKRITLMVDCPVHIALIHTIACAHQVVQPVCMDLDMSMQLPGLWFGVRRSPVRRVADALALYTHICEQSAVKLVGVMGYEAQIAGVPDHSPGQYLQNKCLPYLKQRSIKQLRQRRYRIVKALSKAGAVLDFVNGGGTGSMQSTSRDPVVTEVAVGSAFYAPHLFDHYKGLALEPAVGFALEVSRHPAQGFVTCNGGGYIASGAVDPIKQPVLCASEKLTLLPQEGVGEVQTPLTSVKAPPALASPVLFRHSKAGELCERFNALHVLENGELRGCYSTYRGDGQCFL